MNGRIIPVTTIVNIFEPYNKTATEAITLSNTILRSKVRSSKNKIRSLRKYNEISTTGKITLITWWIIEVTMLEDEFRP